MQFQVQYNAIDTNNNAAIPLNRSILVLEDVVAPSISINGVTPTTIELGSVFEDPGASAFDEVIILALFESSWVGSHFAQSAFMIEKAIWFIATEFLTHRLLYVCMCVCLLCTGRLR